MIESSPSTNDLKAAEASNAEVWSYFIDLVRERRAQPQDDLLSDLLDVKSEGDQLSEGEVIAVTIIPFAAGFETTTVTLWGAANRDPESFTDPDRFDIARDEGTPLSLPITVTAR